MIKKLDLKYIAILKIFIILNLILVSGCGMENKRFISDTVDLNKWVLVRETIQSDIDQQNISGFKLSNTERNRQDYYLTEWIILDQPVKTIMFGQSNVRHLEALSINDEQEFIAIGYDTFTLLLFKKEHNIVHFSKHSNIQNRNLDVCLTNVEDLHTFSTELCNWQNLTSTEKVPLEYRIFQIR